MKLASVTLLLLALLVAGCATTADKLNNVRIGMTKEQVLTLLGPSDSTSAQANIEYLTYYLSTDANDRDRAYSVRLVNGKVESFGRFIQLFDIYNRPVNGMPPTGMVTGTNMVNGTVMSNAAVPSPDDLASQIMRLKTLKDKGVLTEEEFQQAKQKLLSTK